MATRKTTKTESKESAAERLARRAAEVQGSSPSVQGNAFSITDAVDALTYDFRPYCDAHGVVPEPSPLQIRRFQRVMNETQQQIIAMSRTINNLDDLENQIEVMGAVLDMVHETGADSDEGSEIERNLMEGMAAVCSGTPSVEDLNSLPYRGLQAFAGWLVGKFISPEA